MSRPLDRAFDDALGASGRATTASVRRAAWLLHGLPAADRAWVLGQLDDPQRETVGAALHELHELGLGADATSRVAEPVASMALVTPAPAPVVEAAPAGVADPVAPWPAFWRLAIVLREEPDPVAVAVLRAQRRQRQRLLLWSLPAGQRRRLQAALDARRTMVAPGLEAALRQALAQRFAGDAAR